MVKRLPEKIKSMVNSFPSIENYKARNVLKRDFLGIYKHYDSVQNVWEISFQTSKH